MNRRVLLIGLILAVAALLFIGSQSQGSNAAQDDSTDRSKTVEINGTQYVWELVSNVSGEVVCQVIVDHPTQPTNDETLTLCAAQIFPAEPVLVPIGTPTPAPDIDDSEPFDLTVFFASHAWRFVRSYEISQTIQVPIPEMIVNLVVPPALNGQSFVSIYAYEPVLDEEITGIFGALNGWEFSCPSSRCDIPIKNDSVLEFWATSSYGDESEHVMATLRVLSPLEGKRIEISSLTPITLYQDACAVIWQLPTADLPPWAEFPPLPDDLNTDEPYQYLAGQLLTAGVVKAPECPGGGLIASGVPNACGLEKAAGAVIEWQNQFDIVIWQAARDIGIPPVLIKTLIEQESQFWPGNARRFMYEYGFAQLSQAGADVALRWDNELFDEICNGLFYDCGLAYGRQSSEVQAMLRGGLLRAIDSECATCQYGIDLTRARDTIPTFTRILRSNCYQVKYLLDQYALDATYEDMWKFTFVSYHSGFGCLSTALNYVQYNKLPAAWENMEDFVCPSGLTYVNDMWKSLEEFELYRIQRPERGQLVAEAEFVARVEPTATPAPTATPDTRSLGRIRVIVYVDQNANNAPEESEKVEGVSVEARFTDGTVLAAVTQRGEALIDLTGRRIGEEVSIELPDLYRTIKVRVLRDGEIPVIFRLDEPVVPPVLP